MGTRVALRVLRGVATPKRRYDNDVVFRTVLLGSARGLSSASRPGDGDKCDRGSGGAKSGGGGAKEEHCRLLVVGGGAAGCSIAAKFARSLPVGDVVVLEPTDIHYYQPMFTLVGCGIKRLSSSCKPMGSVLPKRARWVKDEAATFLPDENLVETRGGKRLRYEFLVIAMGIELRYQDIPGLEEALAMPGSGVCSNYSPDFSEKTWTSLQALNEGQALFSFPHCPVKCAGAPQKILYLADDYLRRVKRREGVRLDYHTALYDIFGIKYYADALWPIVERRDLNVHLRSVLVEVHPEKRQAVFMDLDNPEKLTTREYAFLHATPPQKSPTVLRSCAALADPVTGFLSVDKYNMQHTVYPNIFGVGDCTNLPTSKTAAAAAAQVAVIKHMLRCAMSGKPLPDSPSYNGYSSCPLVTAKGKCVMAEFDYDHEPIETFPLDQRKELWTMYHVKATFMPQLYWYLMLKGFWEGPGIVRKILHLGFK